MSHSHSTMHTLYQQMGAVLSSIQGLHDNINVRQAQAEQLHEIIRCDIATLRRDQRDLEEKLDFVMCVAQRDIEGLRLNTGTNTRSTMELTHTIDALRRSMSEIAALKSRVAGVLFAAGVLGSSALWLAEPLYRWLIDATLTRQ